MKPHIKEILIGIVIGLAANMAGTYLYIFFFSKLSLESTLEAALENDFLGSLIALGAILNSNRIFYSSKKESILQSWRCCFGNCNCSIGNSHFEIFLKKKTGFIYNSLT